MAARAQPPGRKSVIKVEIDKFSLNYTHLKRAIIWRSDVFSRRTK
jgi:hypothetical protein